MMRDIEKALGDRLTKSEPNEKCKKILILGIGNFLMGDEGIGVHFIHQLIQKNIYFPDADILDGGVGGFALMGHFDDYEHVIIIDATMDGKEPGTISQITPKFASDFPSALSAHDFGLKDMVESMYLLGRVPNLYLFTISIDHISPMTTEISANVSASIPQLITNVQNLVEQIMAEI